MKNCRFLFFDIDDGDHDYELNPFILTSIIFSQSFGPQFSGLLSFSPRLRFIFNSFAFGNLKINKNVFDYENDLSKKRLGKKNL